MSRDVNFCLINPVNLGQPGSLEQILNKMNGLGYDVSDIHVGHWVAELFAFWRKLDDQVYKGLDIAYEKGELTFLAFDEENFASFWVLLRWQPSGSGETRQASVTGYSDPKVFRRQEYGAERNSQLALRMMQELVQIVSPSFAWMEICKSSGFTKLEDVENVRIPHIYWANFFGPRYVEKYGREFFQKAPGWKVEFLEDGGCLYALAPTMVRSPKVFLEQVKGYFSVDFARDKPKVKSGV